MKTNPRNIPVSAADLIESLQADHESYQQVKEALQREGYSDIETMISQYKQVMIAANEHDLDRGEEVERLEAQLAASQRREKAAVEDLKRFSACCQCNANIDGSCCDMFDGTAENKYFCSNWQWRGRKEQENG
jgi:chromosome segregation ATPase